MDTPDQPFDRALLYLRAAGHDTGPETRARLHSLLQVHAADNPALSNGQLLARMPDWFTLPGPCQGRPLPPITRASIGYPRE
ncbi:hypothetical protein SAMN04487869_11032 [Marinobacter sp. DSM 26671]|uniref:Uncharacterized protein n=1 Tax=Marinobacter adhaerens TaxID=1033846 RepID=A0A352IRJ3_9GAMM|nr:MULTISPECIES: hypothetical protein [unclassified Marinobacter]MAK48759.1 hypothetical protein [Marinobacter sp.]MCK5864517.1 hypothetical protein [Marinobacter adhaerens]MCP4065292.1 hypothetical protein [Gammaproteobacteria bacterium]MEC7727622.1 hypothetical protein [Pseudomonadota bacterium]AKV96348.1 hypothetical protein ACP86_09385 [Marinobacter sp. CP1]